MLTNTSPLGSSLDFPQMNRGLPRALDVLVAAIALTVGSPLLIISALAIAVTSRGGVLFRQQRVGRFGKNFVLYKFRTMKAKSEGPQVTMKNDERITRIGKWLRKTKLDELPALWNVVKGDMSLVGPRPEVPRYVEMNNKMWQVVLQVRPGITDPVTLRLRNEEELLASVEEDPEEFYLRSLQPLKLKGYISYLQERSWLYDLKVLRDTLLAVLVPGESPPPTVNKNSGTQRRLPFPLNKLMSRQGQTLLDLSVLVAAFIFSYLLRFEFVVPQNEWRNLFLQLLFVVPLQFLSLYATGVHKFIWRYIGMNELGAFIKAALLSSIPLLFLRIMLPKGLPEGRVPFSIIIMGTILGFAGLMMLRILRRALYERYERRQINTDAISGHKRSVLLIGAGRAGVLAAKEIRGRGDMDLDIKGFIDDAPGKRGMIIQGIKVCGTTQDLPRLVHELDIDHVIITMVQIPNHEIQRIFNICEQIPIKVRVIPGLYEILGGRVEASRVSNIYIESSQN